MYTFVVLFILFSYEQLFTVVLIIKVKRPCGRSDLSNWSLFSDYCRASVFFKRIKARDLPWFIMLGQMNALKDLGLDVSKGTVSTEGSVNQTNFFITLL